MTNSEFDEKLVVCITGDDICKSFESLNGYFAVLKKHKVKAEFFIPANDAVEYPEQVDYILKHQHIVSGHGDIHSAFYDSVSIQTERFKNMMKTFDDFFNLNIEGFRAPYYRHNENTYQALDNAGLKYDCSKKRFEIAYKRIPFFQTRYMYTKIYPVARPLLKLIGNMYNWYCNSPQVPYRLTENVIEFPTLGISDYSLITDPLGPKFLASDSNKISEIWTECLVAFNERGGGVMTLQAHPSGLSPAYMGGMDQFIKNAKKMGAVFSTPNELYKRYY